MLWLSLEDAQAFAEKVQRSARWRRATSVRYVSVEEVSRVWYGATRHTRMLAQVQLRKDGDGITLNDLIHELTHIWVWDLQKQKGRHGCIFIQHYLELMELLCGRRWRLKLERAFVEQEVPGIKGALAVSRS